MEIMIFAAGVFGEAAGASEQRQEADGAEPGAADCGHVGETGGQEVTPTGSSPSPRPSSAP